jgi:hypothetical protein
MLWPVSLGELLGVWISPGNKNEIQLKIDDE